jgi:drug/metabolite transporter (DMT)-like permease
MLMLGSTIAIGLLALARPTPGKWRRASTSTSPRLAGGAGLCRHLPQLPRLHFLQQGVAEVGANKGSLFIHLMPVFGTLLSFLFLGEVPFWYHYFGIGLIFSGIWLTMKR